eukprot:6203595-Pleurochrysis_carterae.AAC.1
MATNPVKRQLACNAMSPQQAGQCVRLSLMARWLSITYTLSFLRGACTRQIVATLEENWGIDLWPALFTQAGEPELSTMTLLRELIRSHILQSMESDATSLDVSRTVQMLVGSLMYGFGDPTDPCRARFPQLHQTANVHREARPHTVLIADTGARSYPDNYANPSQLTSADMAAAEVDHVLSRIPCYAGAGSRNGLAYFHWSPTTTFISSVEVHITAMQGDMSQHALDSSAVLAQPSVPLCTYGSAVATPVDGAYVQFGVAPATGQTMGSSTTQSQPQQIDYPRVTAKVREALEKQVAKSEKHQSIVSYAMDFLNAVGVLHNDTIMVVELRILEVHHAAKQSMDWTSEVAQTHSPTLHAFLHGLYQNADKDEVITTADHIHKRIRNQHAAK